VVAARRLVAAPTATPVSPRTALAKPVQEPQKYQNIGRMLDSTNGLSIVSVIPVTKGTLEAIRPIEWPKQERSIVVMNRNVAERVK